MAIIMSTTRGQISQILACLLAIVKAGEFFFLAFKNPPALDKRPEIGKSKVRGMLLIRVGPPLHFFSNCVLSLHTRLALRK